MKYFLLLVSLISFLQADEKFDEGKEIYEHTCISCHGKDGRADTDIQLVVKPRSLQSSILTQKQSYEIIRKGAHYWGANANIMPAFSTVYDDAQIKSIAYYIKKAFNPNVVQKIEKLYASSDEIPPQKKAKMMKRGKKIYKRNCSWCHGLQAEGDGVAVHNPEKSIYPYNLRKTLLSDKQIFLYAKYGGKFWGTDKDDMPSWKKKYDDYTLKSVTLYIEKTFRGKDK